MKIKLISLFFLISHLFCWSSIAVELKRGRAIRDAEIERVLKSYIKPIFEAANLNPDKLNLVLIYDTDINAAATLDNTIVVNTGLILEAGSAAEIIGVLAHETAHIADGHVIRGVGAAESAQRQSLIGTILGAVIAVAARNTDLGIGMIAANEEMARSIFLKHNRVQEGAADHGALRYLDKIGWTSEGLMIFMKKLMAHDPRSTKDDIYQYTHPLTSERLSAFQHHLSKGLGRGKAIPAELEKAFQRVKAKVEAFTFTQQQVDIKYKGDSLLDQYVHAISAFRNSNFEDALSRVDKLIEKYPKDADYWDLKGQIFFESGKATEAVSAYERAVQLDPDSSLLRVLWAQAMLESGEASFLPQIEQELLRAIQEEPYSPFYWHLLAIAYGKQEKVGLAALSLAERNLLEGSFEDALTQANRAKNHLDEAAPQHSHAEDIINEVNRIKKGG